MRFAVYFIATSLRCQARIVSGVTMLAYCISPLRPSFFPAFANLRLCVLLNFSFTSLDSSCSLRISFVCVALSSCYSSEPHSNKVSHVATLGTSHQAVCGSSNPPTWLRKWSIASSRRFFLKFISRWQGEQILNSNPTGMSFFIFN